MNNDEQDTQDVSARCEGLEASRGWELWTSAGLYPQPRYASRIQQQQPCNKAHSMLSTRRLIACRGLYIRSGQCPLAAMFSGQVASAGETIWSRDRPFDNNTAAICNLIDVQRPSRAVSHAHHSQLPMHDVIILRTCRCVAAICHQATLKSAFETRRSLCPEHCGADPPTHCGDLCTSTQALCKPPFDSRYLAPFHGWIGGESNALTSLCTSYNRQSYDPDGGAFFEHVGTSLHLLLRNVALLDTRLHVGTSLKASLSNAERDKIRFHDQR